MFSSRATQATDVLPLESLEAFILNVDKGDECDGCGDHGSHCIDTKHIFVQLQAWQSSHMLVLSI